MATKPNRFLGGAGLLALAALALAPPSAAQERELHWRELAVHARLDADGALHVEERQAIVFTGDWNGGERRFRVAMGQHLALDRVARLDAATGAELPLVAGDLDSVDHYDWSDSTTLRWRSRAPDDPPFDGTEITYLLAYRLTGVLTQHAGRPGLYRLDHDFAFPDRDGAIERFVLDLDLDPAWRPPPRNPLFDGAGHLHREGGPLPPGATEVVTVDLDHVGDGVPGATLRAVRRSVLFALLAAAAAAAALLAADFVRREAALGRFRRDPELPSHPDRAWIESTVLALPAEQLGALWDREVGSAEVAALLARLVAEGKLASTVKPPRWWFGSPELELELEVPRGELTGYERTLIDKLFFGDRRVTDTAAVRRHYRSRGFSPVDIVRKGIEKRLGGRRGLAAETAKPRARRTLLLFTACLACLVGEGATRGAGQAIVLALLLVAGFLLSLLLGAGSAARWRHRMRHLGPAALGFLLPWAALAAAAVAVAGHDHWWPGDGYPHLGPFGIAACLLAPLVVLSSFLHHAASRETAEMLRLRGRLHLARRWLRAELGRERPALDDAWLPYLLAFGLGGRVARWSRRWGVAAAGGGLAEATTGGGALTSGSSGWTGGGGAFGGGGASGSWTAAIGGMAAGVSAASSSSGGSSGGGGGGGGGSSGGGGGGGW